MNTEINLNEPFGYHIYQTIIKYELKNNLEIGSWDGEGSTRCFVEAMKQLVGSKQLFCIEIDSYKIQNLKNLYKDVSFLTPINNSSVSYEEMLYKDFDIMWNSDYNNLKGRASMETVKGWFDKDIELLKKVKSSALSVLKENKWDSILIDGSEFTGYSEYELVKNNANVFFLDDVHKAFKCYQIYHELKNNKNWELLAEDPNTRNGFAIFKKI